MALTSNTPTRPKLQSIDHDGPVYLRELGKSWNGINWVVQPENFPTLIEMINTHGGPDCWTIVPLDEEDEA